ncbi:MAG: cytochrome P460 family protein [Alphaproteobacteria bacterium]
MKTGIKGLLFLPVFLASFSLALAFEEAAKVDYPDGYRDWTHVKSLTLLENHPFADTFGGLHHVYANDAALEALKNGTPYPDGAVLVFDLFEVVTDAEGGTSAEGPRIRKDVMQKNAALWTETGGWGYETFFGADNERIISDPIATCHSCHVAMEDVDFVFSQYRE